jgi:molecular chaperone GrpE (heat shock protein)
MSEYEEYNQAVKLENSDDGNTAEEVIHTADLETCEKTVTEIGGESEIPENSDRTPEDLSPSYEELQQKNQKLEEENIALKQQLQEEKNRQRLKFENFIQEKLQQDGESYEEDETECQSYRERVHNWIEANQLLSNQLLSAIDRCREQIHCGGELTRNFEQYSPLYKSLSSRYEGLQLIERMLERLQEPLQSLPQESSLSSEALRIQEQDLWVIVETGEEEKQIKNALDKKVREVGNMRYQSVREWRDLAESLQKQWLHFVEKKFLPVLDGIDEGKFHSEALVDDFKKSYPSERENLSAWLQIYEQLQEILSAMLGKISITPMRVEIGQPVDYLRHEPIATEPDPQLPHESVKEITRSGYEYQLLGQVLTLRSAQVIVVKNK